MSRTGTQRSRQSSRQTERRTNSATLNQPHTHANASAQGQRNSAGATNRREEEDEAERERQFEAELERQQEELFNNDLDSELGSPLDSLPASYRPSSRLMEPIEACGEDESSSASLVDPPNGFKELIQDHELTLAERQALEDEEDERYLAMQQAASNGQQYHAHDVEGEAEVEADDDDVAQPDDAELQAEAEIRAQEELEQLQLEQEQAAQAEMEAQLLADAESLSQRHSSASHRSSINSISASASASASGTTPASPHSSRKLAAAGQSIVGIANNSTNNNAPQHRHTSSTSSNSSQQHQSNATRAKPSVKDLKQSYVASLANLPPAATTTTAPITSSSSTGASSTHTKPSASRAPTKSSAGAGSDPFVRHNPTSSSLVPSVVPGGGTVAVSPGALEYFGESVAAVGGVAPPKSQLTVHPHSHPHALAPHSPTASASQAMAHAHNHAIGYHAAAMQAAAHQQHQYQTAANYGQHPHQPYPHMYAPHDPQQYHDYHRHQYAQPSAYPPSTAPSQSSAYYPTTQHPYHNPNDPHYNGQQQQYDPQLAAYYAAQHQQQSHYPYSQQPQSSQPYPSQHAGLDPYYQSNEVASSADPVPVTAPPAGRRRPTQSKPINSHSNSHPPSTSTSAVAAANSSTSVRSLPTNAGPHSPQRLRGPTQTSAPQPLARGTGMGAGQAAVAKLAATANMPKPKPSYKPHTLAEFRDLTLDVKLGSLGPDLDNEERKRKEAHNARVKALAERIREENAAKLAEAQAKGLTKPRKEVEREPSALERAKEFAASKVPKPKLRKVSTDSEPSVVMVAQRIAGSSASTMVPRTKSPERRATAETTKQSNNTTTNGTTAAMKRTPSIAKMDGSTSSTSGGTSDSDRSLQLLLERQAAQRAKVASIKSQMGI